MLRTLCLTRPVSAHFLQCWVSVHAFKTVFVLGKLTSIKSQSS